MTKFSEPKLGSAHGIIIENPSEQCFDALRRRLFARVCVSTAAFR